MAQKEHVWFHHISKKRSPKEALDTETQFAESKGFVCLRPFDSACKIIAKREDALAAKNAIVRSEGFHSTRLQDVYVLANVTRELMEEYRQLPSKLQVKPKIMKCFKVPCLQPEDIGTTRGTYSVEVPELEVPPTEETPSVENKDGTSLAPVHCNSAEIGLGFYNPNSHWAAKLATNALDLQTTRREAMISLPTAPDDSESDFEVPDADWGQPPEDEISEDLGVASSACSSTDIPSTSEEKKEMLVQGEIFNEKFPSKTAAEIHQEKMKRGEVAPPPPSTPYPKALSSHDRKENLMRKWSQEPRSTKPKTETKSEFPDTCIVC